METEKGGFLGNLTKRIGKKHSNKYIIQNEKHPITIHGTIMSIPCRNVLVLGKWIGLDIQLKEVDAMNKREHKSEEYLKMNPAGTMPTLDDCGFHIWESRAILTYLITRYGKDLSNLYPQESQKRAMVDNMLYFDSSSLFAALGDFFYPQIFAGASANSEKEAAMRDKLSVLNTILSKQAYASGSQLTIADLSIVGGLSLLEICSYSLASYPQIEKWIEKVKKEIPNYNEITGPGIEAVTKFFKSHTK